MNIELKLPKSKEVIDADIDEDALLDRIWENDFVKSRVEKYQAIFCTLLEDIPYEELFHLGQSDRHTNI